HPHAVKTSLCRIGVIGGDGIGPEVTAAALGVLDACERRFGFRTERTSFPWSGAHYLATGERLTLEKMAPIRAMDAVLMGAIGHPDAPRGMIERERIIRYAFELAMRNGQKHVTLVDKANAIPIQEIWRDVFEEVGKSFPDVRRDAMYVDAAAMWMVLKPEQFDVVVTTNLFGDIIS